MKVGRASAGSRAAGAGRPAACIGGAGAGFAIRGAAMAQAALRCFLAEGSSAFGSGLPFSYSSRKVSTSSR